MVNKPTHQHKLFFFQGGSQICFNGLVKLYPITRHQIWLLLYLISDIRFQLVVYTKWWCIFIDRHEAPFFCKWMQVVKYKCTRGSIIGKIGSSEWWVCQPASHPICSDPFTRIRICTALHRIALHQPANTSAAVDPCCSQHVTTTSCLYYYCLRSYFKVPVPVVLIEVPLLQSHPFNACVS